MINTKSLLVLVLGSLLMLISCKEMTQILNQLNVQEPKAQVKHVSITDLSLNKVDLLFDIAVDNPNNLGINLNGFDYDLLLDNASFLSGKKETKLQIGANETASVDIPLSLTFEQVKKALKSLSSLDTIPYQLDLKLGVELPVLGVIEVPVSKKGSFPNVRVPTVSLGGIEMGKLGLTGADLNLKIKIKNPNTFSFNTDKLNYNLEVSGKKWISGSLPQSVTIKKKAEQTIKIPVSLNFLDMGTSVYNLLVGDSDLSYRLTGNADFNSDLKILKTFSLPFDKSGKIKLNK